MTLESILVCRGFVFFIAVCVSRQTWRLNMFMCVFVQIDKKVACVFTDVMMAAFTEEELSD